MTTLNLSKVLSGRVHSKRRAVIKNIVDKEKNQWKTGAQIILDWAVMPEEDRPASWKSGIGHECWRLTIIRGEEPMTYWLCKVWPDETMAPVSVKNAISHWRRMIVEEVRESGVSWWTTRVFRWRYDKVGTKYVEKRY